MRNTNPTAHGGTSSAKRTQSKPTKIRVFSSGMKIPLDFECAPVTKRTHRAAQAGRSSAKLAV
jgi:hypothetical protein